MTPQEIFDVYDKLFAQEAWKDLVLDFKQRQIELGQRLLQASVDDKELYRAQGQASIYNYIISLENTMEAAKQHVAEEPNE
jgi:hypothetical protein